MLQPGQEAEVTVREAGYYGAWFACTVLDVLRTEYRVQYCDIHVSEEDNSPLQVEAALHENVRPLPPEINVSAKQWEEGHAVEAYYMDAWWEGVVKERFADGNYWVFFPATIEYMCFEPRHVRPRIEWAHEPVMGLSAWHRIYKRLVPDLPYVTPSQLAEYRARKGLPPEDNTATLLCGREGTPVLLTPGQSGEPQLEEMPASSSEASDELLHVPTLLSPWSLSPHAAVPAHTLAGLVHASERDTPRKRRTSYARAFELPSKQECARKRRNAAPTNYIADRRPLCVQQQEAYGTVLRAFHSQAPALTWERVQLLDTLRKELCIDNNTHSMEISKLPHRIQRLSPNVT